MGSRLSATRHDDILLLTFESDDGFPRLERRILAEIEAQTAKLAGTRELAGGVITGTERAFAVGAEISEIADLTAASAFEFALRGQSVMRAVANSPKPIVAAIRGYCMGGGLDLALACHARMASGDAVFSHPGGSLGIITGWGGTQRLPRLIGRGRALEMLVTGRRLDANEAFACGLVHKISADPLNEAIGRVRTIARALAQTIDSQLNSTRE
ncbi:MAG TPA: enoyl-CoA hydratase/isomerase family protein [Candidatus Acidoferrales bacterium]